MEAEAKRLARRALPGVAVPAARKLDPQTLAYPFSPELAWMASNYLRTPSRALWRLATVSARRLEPLHDQFVQALTDHASDWLGDATRLSVEVRKPGDFPAGPLQIRGAAKSAIVKAARARGGQLHLEPGEPDLLFAVEVRPDAVWLNLDLVGRSMHMRGYRRARGEAPLRENVAAQLLMLARWDPRREALVDPMAGSGTIAIEAAAMAQARPLWCDGFEPLAGRLAPLRTVAQRFLPSLFADARPPIFANEINSETVMALRDNARRAHVADRIGVIHGDFRDLRPERLHEAIAARDPDVDAGLIIVNPPYGQRAESKGAGDPDVAELYEELRQWWAELGAGWRLGILTDHPAVVDIFGRRPTLEKPVSNGQLKAWFRVYANANQ